MCSPGPRVVCAVLRQPQTHVIIVCVWREMGFLPSVLRVSSRAVAITAKQNGRALILQQDWTETGPELGPDWALAL